MELDKKFDKFELCMGKYCIEFVMCIKICVGIGLIDLIF